MKNALLTFFTYFWLVWFLQLIVIDPICVWLGNRYGEGDKYTDTHFIATHLPMGIRVGVYAWLGYHFFIAHRNG